MDPQDRPIAPPERAPAAIPVRGKGPFDSLPPIRRVKVAVE